MKCIQVVAGACFISVLFVFSGFAQAKRLGDPNCMLMRIPFNMFNLAPEVDYEPCVLDGLINHVTKLNGVREIRSIETTTWHDSNALLKFIYSSTYDKSGKMKSDTTVLYLGEKKRYDTFAFSFNSYIYDSVHKTIVTKGYYYGNNFSETAYYNGLYKIDSVKRSAFHSDGTESAGRTVVKYDTLNRLELKSTQEYRTRQPHEKMHMNDERVFEKNTYLPDTSQFFNTKSLAAIFPDTFYYAHLLRRAKKCRTEKILVVDSVSKTVRHILKTRNFSIEYFELINKWEKVRQYADFELEYRWIPMSPNSSFCMVIIQYDDKGDTYCRLETKLYDDGSASFRDAHMILLDYRNYVFQTKYKYTFTDNEGRVSTKSYKYPIKLRHGLVKEYTQHYASGNVIDFFKKPDRAINRVVFQYTFSGR